MARGRKGTAGFTALDEFVLAYLSLAPADRPAAMAALRGADLAIRSKQIPVPATGAIPMLTDGDQRTFEEVGESLATEE